MSFSFAELVLWAMVYAGSRIVRTMDDASLRRLCFVVEVGAARFCNELAGWLAFYGLLVRVCLPLLGVEADTLAGLSAAGGLAVGFASQDIISNFVSGGAADRL